VSKSKLQFVPTVVGSSLATTRNRVRTKSGLTIFVCCGADIILSGLFQDLEGETRCPVCDTAIHLDIESKIIKSVNPPDTVLHYVRCDVGNDSGKFGVMCDNTFLFDREECFREWKVKTEGSIGKVVTPAEFLEEVLARKQG
jgi:Alkylmercury lyase